MATETAGRLTGHTRSVTVTTIAALGGVGAGVAAAYLASGPKDTLGLLLVFATVVVEICLMRVVGIDVSEFGAKDYLYLVFMTFALWFITWGILLTNGVPT